MVLTLFYLEASKPLQVPPGVLTAAVFGVLTNIFPRFRVFPAEGFGWLGQRTPEGIHLTRTSFWNHLFFGVGIAQWTAVLKPLSTKE